MPTWTMHEHLRTRRRSDRSGAPTGGSDHAPVGGPSSSDPSAVRGFHLQQRSRRTLSVLGGYGTMFEPLLGLLTRGYAARRAGRGADFGLRLTRQDVAREVMGLCSNPYRSVAGAGSGALQFVARGPLLEIRRSATAVVTDRLRPLDRVVTAQRRPPPRPLRSCCPGAHDSPREPGGHWWRRTTCGRRHRRVCTPRPCSHRRRFGRRPLPPR